MHQRCSVGGAIVHTEVVVRLNDSPQDRAARNEALAALARRLALTLGVYAVGGLLAWGLGVPLVVVIGAGIVTLVLVVTTT